MTTRCTVGRNPGGRDFVVGDVHGHLQQLQRQLKALHFKPASDRLFFLGDVVDRGPDSAALLDLIDQQSYFSILGNHEAMMIAGFETPGAAALHIANGGAWFYELPRAQQRRTVEQVRQWPWAIEIDCGGKRAGLVHADVPRSNWAEVARQLATIDAAWQLGAPLSEPSLAAAAQKLLWSRALVTQLYSEALAPGQSKIKVSGHLQSSLEWEESIARLSPERLEPFQVSGIDAVFIGHTFVPVATTVGNCHFLDTYREEPGETLSIQCVSEL